MPWLLPLGSQDFDGLEPAGLAWKDLPMLVIDAKKQGEVTLCFLKYLVQYQVACGPLSFSWRLV